MPIVYKFDVLAALKDKGYTTYKLRQDKLLGERTIQSLRNGEPVSFAVLGQLCELLGCNVGDIIVYQPVKTD